jgi:PST family polysaccharide transporter
VVPALVFLAAEADPAIRVLLGERWVPAVPFFRVLCIAGVGASIERVLKWIYLSQGNTERQLRWAFVYAPLMVIAVVAGLRWGAYGVAVGFAAGTWIALPGGIAYCLGASELRWRDFAAALARPAAASVVALAAPLAAASWLTLLPAFPELAASLALYVAGYVLAWLALPGGRAALADLAGMLRNAMVRTPLPVPVETRVGKS